VADETATITMERRLTAPGDLRVVREGAKARVVGYAAVFNKRSVDLGGFVEVIRPKAFTRALAKGPDLRALVNHDPNLVLARTRSDTLRVKQDDVGLAVDFDLPDTSVARDLAVSMERGDVDQMSFAFSIIYGEPREVWTTDEDGKTLRVLNEIDQLYDVSVVTFPAYPDTEAALRSFQAISAEARLRAPIALGRQEVLWRKLDEVKAQRRQ